ncbi:MAG: hypothetical protein ACKO4Z_05470 [Planctomycetota bacterium]|nr:hypothetical protein [Planctomycetota bacterium]
MRLAFTAIPLWLALLPLAAYLVVIGSFHLRRRPVLVAGAVDGALLAAGVSGLVMAGPLALLQPLAGTSPWTAVAFLAACVIMLAFAILATRPRIVIYNIGLDRLRPVVAELVGCLDPAARWAGETAALPSRGLQIHLDDRGPARCVSVIAAGSRPATEAWSEFSRHLRRGIATIEVRRSPWAGYALFALAAAVVAASWAVS